MTTNTITNVNTIKGMQLFFAMVMVIWTLFLVFGNMTPFEVVAIAYIWFTGIIAFAEVPSM